MLSGFPISFRTSPSIVLLLIVLLVLQRYVEEFVIAQRKVPITGYGKQSIVKRQAEELLPKCARDKGHGSVFFILTSGFLESEKLLSELGKHKQVYVPSTVPIDVVNGSFFMNMKKTLRQNEGRIVGYAIKPGALSRNMQEWKSMISKNVSDVRFIVNYPYNLFKAALRNWIMENSAWVDSKAFHHRLSEQWDGEKEIVQVLSKLNKRTCVLLWSYESMERWPLKTKFALHAFLGIPTDIDSVDSVEKRRSSTTMCDMVSNWDNFCRNFFSCDMWYPMLHEYDASCTCEKMKGETLSEFCDILRIR